MIKQYQNWTPRRREMFKKELAALVTSKKLCDEKTLTAVTSFIQDSPNIAVKDLYRHFWDFANDSIFPGDTIHLDNALVLIANTEFRQWGAICEAAVEWGYHPFSVAKMLLDGNLRFLSGVRCLRHLGVYWVKESYGDNYYPSNHDMFIHCFIDYERLGRELVWRQEAIVTSTGTICVYPFTYPTIEWSL